MKLTNLLACAAFLCFLACKNDAPPPAAPLEWQTLKIHEVTCTFPKDTTRCAKLNINLPVAMGGMFPAITAAINDTLKLRALATLNIGDGKPEATIEAAVKAFMGNYRSFLKENGDFVGGYDVDINGKAIFNSSKIASVQVDNYLFTGGAHPNHWTDLHTFDRKTGKTLTAKELFADPAAVAKLLEKPFCELKVDESGKVPALAEILFADTKFDLPKNMAVTKEGVRFYYNPYEMTAYALGDFDILLTWEQLGALAKKETFLD